MRLRFRRYRSVARSSAPEPSSRPWKQLPSSPALQALVTGPFLPPYYIVVQSAQGDLLGLVPLCPREVKRQHPVSTFRFDLVGIYFKRNGEGAVETAFKPLPPVQARFAAIRDGLPAGNSNRFAQLLNL